MTQSPWTCQAWLMAFTDIIVSIFTSIVGCTNAVMHYIEYWIFDSFNTLIRQWTSTWSLTSVMAFSYILITKRTTPIKHSFANPILILLCICNTIFTLQRSWSCTLISQNRTFAYIRVTSVIWPILVTYTESFVVLLWVHVALYALIISRTKTF